MNLLIAIVVQGHNEQAKIELEADKAYNEEKKKDLLTNLVVLFEQLDVDASRTLTKDEFFNASESVRDKMNLLMNTRDLDLLFDIIDHASEGSVSLDEFFEGMMHIIVSHVPILHLQTMKKLEKGEARIENSEMRIMEEVRKLQYKVDALFC
jgi:hypothetical protein